MRRWLAIAGASGVLLFVALVRLPDPIMDDQALFLLGAKALAQGDALYRDFWDLKPPGVFLWYWLAGSLFGYTEIGLHIFDLLWMTIACALLAGAVAPSSGVLRATWTGLAMLAMYLLALDEWFWGQVEAAVLLPLTLVFLGLVRLQVSSRPSIWACAAGFGAGTALVFKPYLGLILAALMLTWLLWGSKRKRRHLLLIGASAAVPILALSVWFVTKGAWFEAFETLVLVPVQLATASSPHHRLGLLLWNVGHFLEHLLPFVVVGIVGLIISVRDLKGDGPSREQQFLLRLSIAWGIGALAAILIQVRSYWSHHFLLMLPVLAVMGVHGACWVWQQGRPARIAYAGLFLACVMPATTLRHNVARVALRPGESLAALAPAERLSYQRRVNESFNVLYEESAILAGRGRPGPIYVWGSPLIYRFTGREAASRISGLANDRLTEPIRERVYQHLLARPPVYVYLGHGWHWDRIVTADRRFGPWLQSQYRPVRKSEYGVWYERSETKDSVDNR